MSDKGEQVGEVVAGGLRSQRQAHEGVLLVAVTIADHDVHLFWGLFGALHNCVARFLWVLVFVFGGVGRLLAAPPLSKRCDVEVLKSSPFSFQVLRWRWL